MSKRRRLEGVESGARLQRLRELMKERELDAYFVGSEDAHASEYVSDADARRSFLTGFSGSAGVALVTMKEALLWTDSRYFLQAEEELKGGEWVLMKQFQPGVPEFADWALEHLRGCRLGVDPRYVSFEQAEEWKGKWHQAVKLEEVKQNLVDPVWTTRPVDPCGDIRVHELEYAGETISSKLTRLRGALREKKADCILLSALDQIAWLFNLRGSDVEYNPVFFAYAAVFQDSALLFLRHEASTEVRRHLEGIEVMSYDRFFEEMPSRLKDQKVFLEPSSSSLALMSLVPLEHRICGQSPVEVFKAAKNAVQAQGLRNACKRDSLVLCELFASLESRCELDEVEVCERMKELRATRPLYVGDSFHTIASAGSNSAVVHYEPKKTKCKRLSKTEMFLIDTGAQWLDGTTDVTRSVHFGEPNQEQRRIYTRVLQGHIALATAVFPENSPGLLLDAYARRPLWQDGLEYGHGTGHGIGAYLNVHEGPAQIGGGCVGGDKIQASERRKRLYLMPLKEGFYVSNEPGCYKDGDFGVRIESDMLTTKAETPYKMSSQQFLKFEYLTLVPFCRKLIDEALLEPRELCWVNEYHERVWRELKDEVPAHVRPWLEAATKPL